MNRRRGCAGVSLVELMVTLAILAALMGVGIPAFAEWLANSRLRTTASGIMNGLQLARAEAIRTNARVRFQLVGMAGGWQIIREAVDGADQPQRCVFVGGATVQSSPAQAGSPIVVTAFSDVSAETATAATWFTFGSNGWQACPPAEQFQALNIDNSAVEAADSRDLNIVVQLGGGVRLCDPHVIATDTRACPN